MKLTARDCELIRMVNDCRALRTDQIERLFFTSPKTAQYRLIRLFHHEYLDRHFFTTTARPEASNQIIYTVGKRGLQVLTDVYNYDRSDFRRPKKAMLSWHLLEHQLALNDVRIAIMQAVSQHAFSLETWIDEKHFRARPDYVTLKKKRGGEKAYPVFPDGYFCVTVPQGKARFFVEVDRGGESLSKFAPQIRVYDAYVASGQYQERFGAKSLRVLIVTSTKRRMRTLMRVTEKVGGDRKYCFTTFDQITPEQVLTGHIWQRLGTRDPEALFGQTNPPLS
jgi:hypothetical protein